MSIQDFRTLFKKHNGRKTIKWDHYLDIYERHLSHYRGTDVHLVEIGVYEGGSLQLWKNYFGPRCHIYGIDINPFCKTLEEEQIEIIIGDQSNREFLRSLREKIPRMDVLIDDGGHRMDQQIATFEELISHIQSPGVYLCEDTHSSYRKEYGGGTSKDGTFLGFTENFPDALNGWHSSKEDRWSTYFKSEITSVHFYDSVVVLEKKRRDSPFQVEAGVADPSFRTVPRDPSLQVKIKIWIKSLLKKLTSFNGTET